MRTLTNKVLVVGWVLIGMGIVTVIAGGQQKPYLMGGIEFFSSPLSFWFRVGLAVALVGFVLAGCGYRRMTHSEQR